MGRMYREIEVKQLMNEAEEEGLSEFAWLTIFADMMTLLLTFFIMLLALSAPNSERYLDALSEVGSSMGGRSIVNTRAEKKEGKERAKDKIQAVIEDNNLTKDVELTSDTRGLVIYSRGDFFFAPGKAEILPDTKLFLKRVARVLKENDGMIMVEGHTDDVPISTPKFPSNWELSTARAASVVRYFIEEQDMYPKRFIVAGYAEYKPRFMVKPANRGKNRRVEIIIMNSKKK